MKLAIFSLLAATVNASYQCTLSSPEQIDSDLYLSQYMNPQDKTVTIELTYQGESWLGFGRSKNGAMIGSDAVIGRVDIPNSSTNPGKYYMTAESDSGVNLVSNQSLLNATVTVDSNGYTVMRFTKYLDESGEYSITGSDDTWIYAVGSTSGDTTFPKFHDLSGSISLTLTPCTFVNDATPAPVTATTPAPVATPAPFSATTPSPVAVTIPATTAPTTGAPISTMSPTTATPVASPTEGPSSSGSTVTGSSTGGDGDGDDQNTGDGDDQGDGDGDDQGDGDNGGGDGDNDGDNEGKENGGGDESDNGSGSNSGNNLNSGGTVSVGSANDSASSAAFSISSGMAGVLLLMLVSTLGM